MAPPTEIEDPAVTNFRRYLRIKTVQPNPDYGKTVKLIRLALILLENLILFKLKIVLRAEKYTHVVKVKLKDSLFLFCSRLS